MKAIDRQSGRTLAEMTVVIAAIVLLGSFGLPAIRSFLDSFESGAGAKAVISAALASARAIAAKEQRYAGIRFQKAYNRDAPLDPLKADQYMVFIINDPNIGAYFFRAVEGLEPMKLPDGLGVMDLVIVSSRNVRNPVNPGPSGQVLLDDPDPAFTPAARDDWLNDPRELTDTTTFSIIFSPSGKLVIHGVRVTNRDGTTDAGPIISMDDTFNTLTKISDPVNPIGMFIQDDYFAVPSDFGLGPEPSRRAFVIYDRREFKSAYDNSRAYSDYLSKLIPNEVIQINPYTGTMVEK